MTAPALPGATAVTVRPVRRGGRAPAASRGVDEGDDGAMLFCFTGEILAGAAFRRLAGEHRS